jgi:hypothetical protein
VARIRSIKPDFFRHRRLYLAERESGLPLRVAFAGLWCAADREGRFRWEPEELKLDCLPFDELDFSRVLDALSTRGFIAQYTSEGRSYGWIPAFRRHQFVNNKELASILPEPPKNIMELQTRAERVDDASQSGKDATATRSIGEGEGKGREVKPRGGNGGQSPEAEAPRRKLVYTAEDEALAKQMFAAVRIVAPSAKEPSYAAWANAIRLMREQDERTHEQIWTVFEWANRDTFWRTNILSPGTLREKLAQLEAKMLAAAPAKPPHPTAPDQWWKSDAGVRIMGEELQISAPPAGAPPAEWLMYRARVLVAAGDGPWLPDEREITIFRAVQWVRSGKSAPPRPS